MSEAAVTSAGPAHAGTAPARPDASSGARGAASHDALHGASHDAQENASARAACRGARLTRLILNDFRSYARADLAFDGRPVAIAGANGAGKTNILEAISLIGPGRGVRGARLDELPRIGGAGGWAVSARFMDAGGDERRFGVGAEPSRPARRVCRIDDAAASGPGAFSDHLRFLWLTPAMDRLFMEGAGERRRFLDRMTLACDPAHGRRASAFEQAMRQRQRLLEEGGDPALASALEIQMAENGVAIAAGRRETAARLAAAEVAGAADLFPAADIALEGELEAALADAKAADVEEDYAARLKTRRRLDAEAGRALLGPHRSDLLVYHRGKGRPARLCSTGEQKALLIGLVLANARIVAAQESADAPLILLLDEIAAHLDPDRRAGLFSIIDALGFQAFMTGTDKALFAAWGERAQHLEACGGALHPATLT